jgi:hypothetical protein
MEQLAEFFVSLPASADYFAALRGLYSGDGSAEAGLTELGSRDDLRARRVPREG